MAGYTDTVTEVPLVTVAQAPRPDDLEPELVEADGAQTIGLVFCVAVIILLVLLLICDVISCTSHIRFAKKNIKYWLRKREKKRLAKKTEVKPFQAKPGIAVAETPAKVKDVGPNPVGGTGRQKDTAKVGPVTPNPVAPGWQPSARVQGVVVEVKPASGARVGGTERMGGGGSGGAASGGAARAARPAGDRATEGKDPGSSASLLS